MCQDLPLLIYSNSNCFVISYPDNLSLIEISLSDARARRQALSEFDELNKDVANSSSYLNFLGILFCDVMSQAKAIPRGILFEHFPRSLTHKKPFSCMETNISNKEITFHIWDSIRFQRLVFQGSSYYRVQLQGKTTSHKLTA
ncbi:hypothetical protein RRG08_057394 [Elysia crispata]|uniref:Uncharacterized protein n=1 Tax=Elysia crispata TaxID=231223 RepID=A0AAE1E8A5_9GAST|nr:hypothetical protein RRG08_057394 [Elysia crispata]